MLRSRLYWRVLANFGLLLLILTAMTVLTFNLLSQIERNFASSSVDTQALGSISHLRVLLNDLHASAQRYALDGEVGGKEDYAAQWKELSSELTMYFEVYADSLSRADIQIARDNCNAWKQSVGDKLISLGDERMSKGSSRDLESQIQGLVISDARMRYLSAARTALSKIYEQRMPAQLRSLKGATQLSSRVGEFVLIVNILLAVFSVALGFVLTRSITTPIRLLKDGTQNIMAGRFEPITLTRTDELGDLAADFNKMSSMLGSNYHRLNAYSELVTTLNSSASMEPEASMI